MLLALVFLLSACRTENLIDENISANQSSRFQPTFKKISLNEAKHKSKLLPIIEQVETGLESEDNLQGKTTNYGNGVSIDTDDVIFIENGTGFHSYTFHINRENAPADAPVENLLLRPLSDGTYKEFLVAYNFTPQEKQIVMSGGYVDTNGKTTVTELASGTYSGVLAKTSCSYQTVTINIPCTSKEHHMPGQKCDMTGNDAPRSFTMVALVCGADTSLGDDGEPGGGVSIGNVGGLGSGNPETETPTMPYIPTFFRTIVRTLPIEVKTFLNTNTAFYNGLDAYYTANQTLQGENFVRWAAQFSWENQDVTWTQFQNWFIKADGTSKITINTTSNSNALTFNNMVEFKNYITGFKNSFTPDASSFESINNTNITKFKAKFDILAPVYLNIHAKSTLEDPNTYATEFDLLEVNSFKSGISAFLTWNQDSYGHSVDGHVVEINLNGHFDIGVKIGDLDFTYADSYIIKAKYNNITGNAMSISGTPD